jgi:hypothetical protein
MGTGRSSEDCSQTGKVKCRETVIKTVSLVKIELNLMSD